MKCPHCGFEKGPAGARFCLNCGSAMPQAAGTGAQVQVSQEVDSVEGGTVTGVSIRQVIGNVFVGAGDETQARRRRNLHILLDKVKDFWVEGVLARSVQGATLIELGKRLQPEAVDRPWEAVVPSAEPAAGQLPPDEGISDLFEEMDHALLVLDGVGSGKTVTLLELARDSIGRAEQDPLQPIPVVLNLSSWTQPRQPIADWVVDELNAKYQIPTRLARQWLENSELVLLLDGLDELEVARLPACIAAINEFRQEYGLVQLAVCSRTQPYEAVGDRLKLSGAVLLEPVTDAQIEQYLVAAGPRADALQAVLQEDDALKALARSPLMLNMMRLAYQDVPLEALREERLDTPEERRELLLNHYVERMFEQVAGTEAERYPRPQASHWLAWLAWSLSQHQQGLFLIERLQPNWLPGRARRWLYALLTRTLAGLVLGFSSVAWGYLLPDLVAPAWWYLLVGAGGGLLVGLVDGLRFELATRESARPPDSGPRARRLGLDILALILWTGLVSAAIYLLRWKLDWVFGLKEGLMFALAFGLIFGLRNRTGGPDQDTKTVEALAWSPAGSLRGVLAGLVTALLLAVVYGLVVGLFAGSGYSFMSASIFLSITAPPLAVAGILFGGLRGTILEARTRPNQGIWLSARNALLVGLAVSLAGGLSEAVINVLIGQVLGARSTGLETFLIAALFWGIVGALWYGGLDLIKHFTLRALLWLGGHMPWHYARFLEYAVARSFLQRAGGGYLFANRLLQRYFAERQESIR